MEVELIYKENSFVFNISPFMPISYLRTLSHKIFHIPFESLNLSYQNINIEKQYNDSSLSDFFHSPNNRIIVKVTESDSKNLYKTLLTSTISSSLKIPKLNMNNVYINNNMNNLNSNNDNLNSINSNLNTNNNLNINSNNNEERKNIKKQFDINRYIINNELNESKKEEEKKKEKCEICQKREISIFCREECKFLCKVDKNMGHINHKYLNVEQGNIEQCGYFYQKELINEIQNQENEVKNLIEKANKERLNDKIEEIYDILAKIGDTERNVMDNIPSLPLDSITNNDYNEIKRNIYYIKDNIKSKNPFSYSDKKSFFKELQKEDFNLDSLKKDIESIKRKYDFQDMLCEILEQLRIHLEKLNESLNEIWNGNRFNVIAFSHDMEEICKTLKKKFLVNVSDSEEENSDFESDLEEIYFENKNNNNRINNVILPKLSFKKKKENNSKLPLFNSLNVNLERRKKISNNNILKFESEDSDSNDSEEKERKKNAFTDRLNNKTMDERKNKFNHRKDDIQLDQILLNENNVSKGPKRPPKRNSIRMSIFVRNMNKVDSASTSKIMKVKKKKKKMV